MLNTISSWIISIAGIICISVIVELILPEGQMNRYIKSVFSFIIVLIIILPIPKLLKTEIQIDRLFDDGEHISVDEDYLYQLNLYKINIVKEKIENKIQEHGYKNVYIYVSADIFQNKMQFKYINVDLSKLIISENSEHNDIIKIKQDITSIITSYVNISEEAVLYDE